MCIHELCKETKVLYSEISVWCVIKIVTTIFVLFYLSQVWPIAYYPDQEVCSGSLKLVDEHNNKYKQARILMQVWTLIKLKHFHVVNAAIHRGTILCFLFLGGMCHHKFILHTPQTNFGLPKQRIHPARWLHISIHVFELGWERLLENYSLKPLS